jgi:hypothetical protein
MMSERSYWKSNTLYTTQFKMMDRVGAPITGAVNGDFVKRITYNSLNSAVVVTVTEIDSVNHPGEYKVTYTPTANGYWTIVVTHATYNPYGWQDDIQVYSNDAVDDALLSTKLIKAMTALDTSTSPWSVCLVEQGTGSAGADYLDGTILRRIYIYDYTGNGITSQSGVVASQLDA